MRVHLSALGCRLNEAELQTWSESFIDSGFAVTPDLSAADVMVFNTCAVTAEAARKSRQQIRRLHRENPRAKLVVSGCYASLEKQQAESLLGVDLVVSNSDKDSLVTQVVESLDFQEMPALATEPGAAALFSRNRERAFIKVQDGCRYRCTYCIVTVARGDERSRTEADIVTEVNQQVASGVKEIVLTGVHVGGYGSDLATTEKGKGKRDLHSLVETILAETDVPRIRFASVEPWDLPEAFFGLFENSRLMPHMHLPLQSGTDSVLRRMSRRCKTEDFAALVAHARNSVPGFNVTTDIIVGFPGETDQEFAQTMAFVESIGFGHIHIFSYSNREGTKAARLPGQIDKAVKRERSQAMHELASRLKHQALSEMVATTPSVLWESSNRQDSDGLIEYHGYTPNYHRVAASLPPELVPANQLLDCRIESVDHDRGLLRAQLLQQPKPLQIAAVELS